MPARRPRSPTMPAPAPVAASIEVSEEAGVRYLHFGSPWIQGAMRVRRSDALELEYTRDMMFPLLIHAQRDWPRNVLIIGLGAGSITKFLYRHRPQAHLTVVEIEPRVIGTAQHCFKLPEDAARLSIEIADGAAYVAQPGPTFDWIVVDGFDARGLAGTLDTRNFYRHCRARLTDRGVLVTNLLRRTRGCAASIARMGEAFDGRVLALPTCKSGNTVAIAAVGAPRVLERQALMAAAAALRDGTGLNLLRIVGRLAAVAPEARAL